MPNTTTARLSPATAQQIKAALWSGRTQKQTARDYGVSQASVSAIARGASYEYVPWPDGSFDPPARRDVRARAAGLEPPSVVPQRPSSLTGTPPVPALRTEDDAMSSLASILRASVPLSASITERDPQDGSLPSHIEDAVERAELSGEAAKQQIDLLVEETRLRVGAAADADLLALVHSASAPLQDSAEAGEGEQAAVHNMNEGTADAEALPWDDILAIAGSTRSPWIALARRDETFRRALCIVCAATAPNDWGEPFIYPLCLSTLRMLGIDWKQELST